MGWKCCATAQPAEAPTPPNRSQIIDLAFLIATQLIPNR